MLYRVRFFFLHKTTAFTHTMYFFKIRPGQLNSVHSPPGSPHPAHITSSQSPSLSSPITASVFGKSGLNPIVSRLRRRLSVTLCIAAKRCALGLEQDTIDDQ